jgi:hypothetical protein
VEGVWTVTAFEKEKSMGESSNVRKIDLGDDFGDVAVKANGVRVLIHTDGSLDAYTEGTVKKPPATNDTASKTTHEIGAIESTGEHKGEIYGGIYPADNKPIWFLLGPRPLDHFEASRAPKWGCTLPTRAQGDYLTTLKGKGGAFTEIFNRSNSFPAGYVWLAEPVTNNGNLAWCQRLSDGFQDIYFRNKKVPVLLVQR